MIYHHDDSMIQNIRLNIGFQSERKMSQTPPSFAEELNLHNDSSERERKKVVTLKQVCTTAFLLFLRLLRTRKCSLHKIRRYVTHR